MTGTDHGERGQTTLDFVVGFGIFVVALAFVFTASAGLLSPFAHHQVSDPLLADRTADHLTGSVLVDSPADATLNETATDEFFNETDPPTEYLLNADLGIGNESRVNVTLENTTTGAIKSDPSFQYSRGQPYPSDSGRVSVSQRIVVYDGETYWLQVRVW